MVVKPVVAVPTAKFATEPPASPVYLNKSKVPGVANTVEVPGTYKSILAVPLVGNVNVPVLI